MTEKSLTLFSVYFLYQDLDDQLSAQKEHMDIKIEALMPRVSLQELEYDFRNHCEVTVHVSVVLDRCEKV